MRCLHVNLPAAPQVVPRRAAAAGCSALRVLSGVLRDGPVAALVAEYQTAMPQKALLQRKLHELYEQLAPTETGGTPAARKLNRRKAREDSDD